MKKFLPILILILSSILFVLPTGASASDPTIKNTGFIQTNIWYSKDSFYAGDTVRIYTAIFNGTQYDLSGSVEFLDNDIVVGKTEFDLINSGQVRDVSVLWKAGEGDHSITARIVNAATSLHGGPKTTIALENSVSRKSTRAVEVDPILKEARAKADAAKVAETGTQVAGTVAAAVQTVTNVIPTPIKDGASASVNAMESLRTTLATQLQNAKVNQGKAIDVINARSTKIPTAAEKAKQSSGALSTVSSTMEKPYAYVTYGILALLQYFFEWKVLFYGVLFYGLYRLAKWGIQKVRNR
jgi:hypothetical protein